MKFSDVLKELLEEKNITIPKLSKQLIIDDSTLYDYLYGALPSVKNAVKLANYFDCTINFLMGLDDEPKMFAFQYDYKIENFIARYNNLLTDANTTHFKLSKICGVNYSSYYSWQMGGVPAMSSLLILSRYFDVSIDYLIGRSDIM